MTLTDDLTYPDINKVPLCDFSSTELFKYFLDTNPSNPIEACRKAILNYDVGMVVGNAAISLLEGYLDVKNERSFDNLSKQNSSRRLAFTEWFS